MNEAGPHPQLPALNWAWHPYSRYQDAVKFNSIPGYPTLGNNILSCIRTVMLEKTVQFYLEVKAPAQAAREPAQLPLLASLNAHDRHGQKWWKKRCSDHRGHQSSTCRPLASSNFSSVPLVMMSVSIPAKTLSGFGYAVMYSGILKFFILPSSTFTQRDCLQLTYLSLPHSWMAQGIPHYMGIKVRLPGKVLTPAMR